MTRNVYFSQGTRNEQHLLEDIIIESISAWGVDMYYIPRSLVSKDEILGEDRLSEFKTAYPIEVYLENVDGFDGQGAFIQKFGLMMEQTATVTVASRRWEQLVGRFGKTQLPNRPNEGDLLYFPLSGGLFEIKFVQHQDPFYQLGKLYVYKLSIELFQYASEKMDTGLAEIDAFETLKTFSVDTDVTKTGQVSSITVTNGGSNYTQASVEIVSTSGIGATAQAVIQNGSITAINITNGGSKYKAATVTITGNGTGATATAVVENNIDAVESYGDNNKFKEEAKNFVFNENNPFGEVNGR